MQKEKKKRHKYTKKYKKQRTNAVNDADETKITATPMVLNTKGLEAMGKDEGSSGRVVSLSSYRAWASHR